MKNGKLNDQRFKIHRSHGCGIMTHTLNSGGTWLYGAVVTANGIVLVMSQDGYTRLDAVSKGHHFTRGLPRRYTKRGLVTLASKYAAYVKGVR